MAGHGLRGVNIRQRLDEDELDGQELRTLTFGDRTISYDTGLNFAPKYGGSGEPGRFARRIVAREDSVRSTHSEWDSGAGSDCSEGASEVEEKEEEGRDKSISEVKQVTREEEETDRRVIKPDICAISQLLNFDEEEENDLSSEEEEGEEEKRRWRCALVKDLTTTGRSGLTRRHSVTLCTNKSTSTAADQVSKSSKKCSKQPAPVKEEPPALATLDLNLEEVAHIRSVLTRAELDALPLDTGVKEAVEGGRLCFLCLTTRFGLFTRATQCQVCRQMVCNKCSIRMRIPVEQFNAVPVEVLSPTVDSPSSLPADILTNCAGSAPSSPKVGSKAEKGDLCPALAPLSPPPVTSVYTALPRRAARRWSMISSRESGREKLEGSMLAVCADCKSMVLQVIRSQGRSRRCRRGQRREECGL